MGNPISRRYRGWQRRNLRRYTGDDLNRAFGDGRCVGWDDAKNALPGETHDAAIRRLLYERYSGTVIEKHNHQRKDTPP